MKNTIFRNGVRRLNISEASRQLGVSRVTLYKWLQDPGAMRVNHFVRLCKLTGMDAQEIAEAIRDIGGKDGLLV